MWIGMILLGYFIGVGLLIRFFQAVHRWDDQIEAMEYQSAQVDKKRVARFRTAA
jgi:hypothetical protein